LRRLLGLLLASTALLSFAVPPASAGEKLSIRTARQRASAFAERTCSHDANCARSGVQNCRRESGHVVLCRIFDHRKTDIQGTFVCTRLVRLALKLPSRKVPVTGVGDWSC
jgi:hypothetical protein